MHSHLRGRSSTLGKRGCLHHPTLSARTKSVFKAVLHWCTIVFMRRLLRLLLFWTSEFRKYATRLKQINLVPGTTDWPWFSSTHMRTSGLRCQGLWRASGIWQRPGPASTPSRPQNAWSQRKINTVKLQLSDFKPSISGGVLIGCSVSSETWKKKHSEFWALIYPISCMFLRMRKSLSTLRGLTCPNITL